MTDTIEQIQNGDLCPVCDETEDIEENWRPIDDLPFGLEEVAESEREAAQEKYDYICTCGFYWNEDITPERVQTERDGAVTFDEPEASVTVVDDLETLYPDNRTDDDRRTRVIEEILTDVEMYFEAPGPEGPWEYRSLTIQRRMNTLHVYDADDVLYRMIGLPDMSEFDDPQQWLRGQLDELHHESIQAL